MLTVHATGLIYRNPRPHVRSIHAYFPSVAVLEDGDLLGTIVLGEAFEAVNLRTHLVRSRDRGDSWQLEGPLSPGTLDRLTSDSARLAVMPDGEVVANLVRVDRSAHPDEGLASHATLGFAPTELLLFRSHDGGRHWDPPERIDPPLAGPEFELCAPVTPLRDGRWVYPTSTWRSWDGACPNGIRQVGLVSHDRGKSWPDYMDVMSDPANRCFFWESKIIELGDGRLYSIAWVYDEQAGRDLPNHYTLSADGGHRWLPRQSMAIQGQTMTPLLLDDGRILHVYRRVDEPGLWATVSRLDGDRLVHLESAPLWGQQASGLISTSANMAHNFNVLRFGAPCMVRLPDGTIFLAFWCVEDCVGNIRWFKFTIN